jgi:hypothetical protein
MVLNRGVTHVAHEGGPTLRAVSGPKTAKFHINNRRRDPCSDGGSTQLIVCEAEK